MSNISGLHGLVIQVTAEEIISLGPDIRIAVEQHSGNKCRLIIEAKPHIKISRPKFKDGKVV